MQRMQGGMENLNEEKPQEFKLLFFPLFLSSHSDPHGSLSPLSISHAVSLSLSPPSPVSNRCTTYHRLLDCLPFTLSFWIG